jgi:hypothetical protein
LTKKKFYVVLLFLAAFLPFFPNLRDFFVGDDFCLIDQSRNISWNSLAVPGFASYFRPLALVVYHLIGSFFGLNPIGFHLISIFFHSFNVILLFFFIRLLTDKATLALLTSLAFAWHFAHAEAVIWISSLNELLVVTFGLLYLMGLFISGEFRKPLIYGATLLFLALALISKESAIVLPFVAIGLLFLGSSRQIIKKIFLFALPILLTLGMILLRSFLGAAMPTWTPGMQGAISLSPVFVLSNYAHFLIGLFVPLRLFFDLTDFSGYERMALLFTGDSLLTPILFAVLFIGLIIVILLVVILRPGKVFWLGVYWVICALLPYVFFSGKGERFLYLASAGASLMTGALLFSLLEKRRILGTVLVILLFGFSLGVCYERGRWWTRAGQVTSGVLEELKETLSSDSLFVLVDVPKRIHGAYVFTNCIGPAVRLFVPGFSGEVLLVDREDLTSVISSNPDAEILFWSLGGLSKAGKFK